MLLRNSCLLLPFSAKNLARSPRGTGAGSSRLPTRTCVNIDTALFPPCPYTTLFFSSARGFYPVGYAKFGAGSRSACLAICDPRSNFGARFNASHRRFAHRDDERAASVVVKRRALQRPFATAVGAFNDFIALHYFIRVAKRTSSLRGF